MKSNIKVATILGYVQMVITIIINLLYTPFMLRVMGQSEYGLYSLISSVIAYLSVLDMGFGNAMVRFVSRSQARNDNKEDEINGLFLFLYTIIGILSLAIGFVLYCNIDLLFSSSLSIIELKKAKILMIILLVTVSVSFPLSVFDSYVLANEKFVFLRIITITKNLLVPCLMIPLLLIGFKSISMGIVISSLTILYHIVLMIYSFKKLKLKIVFNIRKIDKELLKEIFIYSFFVFLNIIVDNLYNNTDKIILGSVSGTIAVSIYALAAQISQMNQQFSTTISGMFLPKITKLNEEKNGDKKISELFIKVSRIQLYIMMLILSGFIIFGKEFIAIWAGKEYADAYLIVLLLIGPAIIPLSQNLGISILQAKNKHFFRSITYLFIAVLNVFISIPLAKQYGSIGAAIGTALATFAGQIITMNIYYNNVIHLDISTYWKHFVKFGVQILCITMVFYFIVNNIKLNFIMFVLGIILYSVIYLIISYINMNSYERGLIFSIISKIKEGKKC